MAIARAHPEEFRLTSTPITDEQRAAYFGKAFADQDRGDAFVFVLKHAETGQLVGTSRLTEISRQHRNCELGYTWIDPRWHGTAMNVESKFLLLGFAFEDLELLRVQIRTDVRNVRSQAAIRSLGAIYEGVLRRHMITKDGFVRDSMVFSITDLDWPQVKGQLQERIRRKQAR